MKGHGETRITAGFLMKFSDLPLNLVVLRAEFPQPPALPCRAIPSSIGFFPSCLKENMRMFRIANSPPSNACSAARRGGQAGRRSTPRRGKRRLAVSARLIIGALYVIHIMFVAGDLAI